MPSKRFQDNERNKIIIQVTAVESLCPMRMEWLNEREETGWRDNSEEANSTLHRRHSKELKVGMEREDGNSNQHWKVDEHEEGGA